MKFLHYLSYSLLRLCTFPLVLLSYSLIHSLGEKLGTLIYHLYPKMRKRALSNLTLASDLHLTPEQIPQLAKKSIQNLVITCLEFSKIYYERDMSRLIVRINPEIAKKVMDEGKGAVFFCGHQANWELLFLDASSLFPAVAIGRPIKNPYLYKWILAIREKMGGKLIPPRNALKESLRAIKHGKFIGIVGDQGMPDSGFSSLFLGRRAWTSPLPALLSHRTERPIIVCTLHREKGKYHIRYNDPIWPDKQAPAIEERERLMKETLATLENSIKQNVAQWLWTHNRWKQQLPGTLKKIFRHEIIKIILPEDEQKLRALLPLLSTFRKLYPQEFITLLVPKAHKSHLPKTLDMDICEYSSYAQIQEADYLHKLIFNFSMQTKLTSPSAFGIYTLKKLRKIAKASSDTPLSTMLKTALLKENHAS